MFYICWFWFQLGHVFSDMEMAATGISSSMTPTSAFQLGHVFSDMEIRLGKKEVELLDRFQLGHVFSDMEMPKSMAK